MFHVSSRAVIYSPRPRGTAFYWIEKKKAGLRLLRESHLPSRSQCHALVCATPASASASADRASTRAKHLCGPAKTISQGRVSYRNHLEVRTAVCKDERVSKERKEEGGTQLALRMRLPLECSAACTIRPKMMQTVVTTPRKIVSTYARTARQRVASKMSSFLSSSHST